MVNMTQHERILDYIDRFGSITPMDAFMDLGITKLATRIGEISRAGHRIEKKVEFAENRFGQKVHYMRYKKAV